MRADGQAGRGRKRGGAGADGGDAKRHCPGPDPSVKVTEPSVTGAPEAVTTTDAAIVTEVPEATGLGGEKARVTVVGAGPELALEPGVPLMSAAPAKLANATS